MSPPSVRRIADYPYDERTVWASVITLDEGDDAQVIFETNELENIDTKFVHRFCGGRRSRDLPLSFEWIGRSDPTILGARPLHQQSKPQKNTGRN
jgi:hypothetical protein